MLLISTTPWQILMVYLNWILFALMALSSDINWVIGTWNKALKIEFWWEYVFAGFRRRRNDLAAASFLPNMANLLYAMGVKSETHCSNLVYCTCKSLWHLGWNIVKSRLLRKTTNQVNSKTLSQFSEKVWCQLLTMLCTYTDDLSCLIFLNILIVVCLSRLQFFFRIQKTEDLWFRESRITNSNNTYPIIDNVTCILSQI